MAISATTLWQLQATATANNVNGGGFNTGNAAFPTDATATSATGNAPVISSATYSFVAGDVGAWVYIKSGTNWLPGFYNITSVTTGTATVNATLGSGVTFNATTQMWGPSTVAGVASTASPTAGTYGVDYSQQDAAKVAGVANFNAVGASTTLTSATAGFTPVMVGNIFHQTTTGTGAFGIVGWYEIATYVNVTTVTLDRTPNSGTASVNTTGSIGGAMSMGALDDAFTEAGAAGNTYFVKNGTYTIAGAVSVSLAGTRALPISFIGFNSVRGDSCLGSNRPIFSQGTNAWTYSGGNNIEMNLIHTGSAASMFSSGAGFRCFNCKYLNNSTTAGRTAVAPASTSVLINSEIISYRGFGISASAPGIYQNLYVHDSDVGIRSSNSDTRLTSVAGCVFVSNVTTALSISSTPTGNVTILGNTIYGAENKLGVGINLGASASNEVMNNIIYGFTTGVSATATQLADYDNFNDYFNNTSDVSNWVKGPNDLALDPVFSSVSQITGTNGTTSGSVLTSSGANFGAVVDGQDYLYIVSGTGITAGIYGITSHTTTTLTLDIAPGTSATADKVFQITVGRNFSIGTNLKAVAFPGTIAGLPTTGYLDTGAFQRQEQGTGGSGASVAYS